MWSRGFGSCILLAACASALPTQQVHNVQRSAPLRLRGGEVSGDFVKPKPSKLFDATAAIGGLQALGLSYFPQTTIKAYGIASDRVSDRFVATWDLWGIHGVAAALLWVFLPRVGSHDAIAFGALAVSISYIRYIILRAKKIKQPESPLFFWSILNLFVGLSCLAYIPQIIPQINNIIKIYAVLVGITGAFGALFPSRFSKFHGLPNPTAAEEYGIRSMSYPVLGFALTVWFANQQNQEHLAFALQWGILSIQFIVQIAKQDWYMLGESSGLSSLLWALVSVGFTVVGARNHLLNVVRSSPFGAAASAAASAASAAGAAGATVAGAAGAAASAAGAAAAAAAGAAKPKAK